MICIKMAFNYLMLFGVLMSLAMLTTLEAKPQYRDLDSSLKDLKVSVIDPLAAQFSSFYEDVVSSLKCSYLQIANNLQYIFGIFNDSSEDFMKDIAGCLENLNKYITPLK